MNSRKMLFTENTEPNGLSDAPVQCLQLGGAKPMGSQQQQQQVAGGAVL